MRKNSTHPYEPVRHVTLFDGRIANAINVCSQIIANLFDSMFRVILTSISSTCKPKKVVPSFRISPRILMIAARNLVVVGRVSGLEYKSVGRSDTSRL